MILRVAAAVIWLLALVLWAVAAVEPASLAGRWSRLCHLMATGLIIASWWVVA
jgi:hypothetical protein